MTRQRQISKGISVFIAVVFFWTNCVYASGMKMQGDSYLGVDGKGLLAKVFPEFRALSTPLAMHNAIKAEGITGLRDLVNELEGVKNNLVTRGVITKEEADRYPAAVMFDDPATNAKAYYYFNREGYFIRYTELENVNDSLYRAFLQPGKERVGEVVPINGGYVERFRVSEDSLAGISETLKRLYGYSLEDILEVSVQGKDTQKGSPADCLRELCGIGLGEISIRDLIQRRGYSRSTVYVELNILKRLGLVESTSKGVYCLSNIAKRLSLREIEELCELPEFNKFKMSDEEIERIKKLINAIGNYESIVSARKRYDELCRSKNKVSVTFVYDYTTGKEKAFKIDVPVESELTEDERGFVIKYLAFYVYNRLTSIGAKNLKIYIAGRASISSILVGLVNIFMQGSSFLDKMKQRMRTFYGDFQIDIKESDYTGGVIKTFDPDMARTLRGLESVKGTFVGLDVGGSNMKVVLVVDGKMVYSHKLSWKPKRLRDVLLHVRPVKAMIELAILKAICNVEGIDIGNELGRIVTISREIKRINDNPEYENNFESAISNIEVVIANIKARISQTVECKKYVDGIGISWPDIVRENKIVGGLTGKVQHLPRGDFEREIKPLAEKITSAFGINTFLINDGDSGAFIAGVKLGRGNIVGIALGTSTGVGYLDENGEIEDYITDMSHIILNFNETDPEAKHETTKIPGTMQNYLGQQSYFRPAERLGLHLNATEDTEKLEELQRLYGEGDPRLGIIIERIAVTLADGIQDLREDYFSDTPIGTFVLSGRVVEGRASKDIVRRAGEILAERGIDVELILANELDPTWDEAMNDLAQAVGAAYFAAKNMEVHYKGVLRLWLDQGNIDDSLYRDAVSLIEDKKYGRTAADEVMDLVKKEDIDALKVFVNEVIGRRKNVDRINALLDPSKPYEGYDVIIITSSTQAEADLQGDTLRRLFSGANRDVKILSVVEDWASAGGAGNFLGTLYAYIKAKEEARTRYGIDLDLYTESGRKMCVIHNGGLGKRDNPFTVSYDNSRGAQRLVGDIKLQDGTSVPITLLGLTILSNCINAVSNNGEQIDVYWASQIMVGNKGAELVFKDSGRKYLFNTYGMILPADREVTEKDLQEFSVWEANEESEAVAFHKAKTFRNVGEWNTWRDGKAQEGQTIFRDIGSHRFSRKLFISLMHQFNTMLQQRQGKIDLSYDLIQPLMIIVEAFQGVDLTTLNNVGEVETRLGELGRLGDLQRLSPENYRKIIEIFLAVKGEIQSIIDWIKIVDLGDSPYWWTYRRPIDKLNYDLAIIADLIGKRVVVDDNGQAQEKNLDIHDKIMAEDMRRIRTIEYPVENVIINGKKYSFTIEEVRRGVEVDGVYIKGSIVRNCVLFSGSRIVNSIVEDVTGEIISDNSELVGIVVPKINVKNSIIHNLIVSDEITVEGRSISGVYRAEIKDNRYPDGMTVMNIPIGLDTSKNYDNVITDGDNRYSFAQLYSYTCDRRANETLRNEIKVKTYKLIAKRMATEFKELYRKLGEDVLPDISREDIIPTADQIKARKCIEIIIRIGMMEDETVAMTAIGPLFGGIIEYLSDSLTRGGRNVSSKIMTQITQIARRYPICSEFSKKLSGFGLNTEADLVRYHSRIRNKQFIFDQSRREEVRKIVVLPRVSIGAEIAIISPLIARLMEVYPNAEIVFVGDKKIAQIFSGNPRIRVRPLRFERRGALGSKLNAWLDLLNVVQEENPDFVFGPDSRTDSLGLYPLVPDERYFFWENTFAPGDSVKPMAELINDKLDRTFGRREAGHIKPTLWIQDRYKKFAKEVENRCGLENRYVVGVKYDVGGNYEKALGHDFEWEYLQSLLREKGNVVIMDRGFDEQELRLSQRLIDRARDELGVQVVEVTDLEQGGKGRSVEQITMPDIATDRPVLIVFHGTIGGWVALEGIADEVFAYDSVGHHAGAAVNTPLITVFTGYNTDIFPRVWRPIGRNSVSLIETGVGKCADWHPILDRVKQTHENLRFRNSLPLELSNITGPNYQLSSWPTMEQVNGLSIHTQVLASFPTLVNALTDGEYQEELAVLYGLAYIRQLDANVREQVFSELRNIGYGILADWLIQNKDKTLEEQVQEITKRVGRIGEDTDRIISIARLRDRIVTYSRSLRIAVETVEMDPSVLKEVFGIEELLWVLFGLRDAVIIDAIDDKLMKRIEELLWTFKQIEDIKVNILRLPDGRLYIYDEYSLKNKAVAKGKEIAVTRQGLEHLIKISISTKTGLFYELATASIPVGLERNIAKRLSEGVLTGQIGKRFSVWDNERHLYRGTRFAKHVFELEKVPVETIYIGTDSRPVALRNQLETELENQRIFNYKVPIVVINGSQGEVLKEEQGTMDEFRARYNADLVMLTVDDWVNDLDTYADRLIEIYQGLLDRSELDQRIRDVLDRNGVIENGRILKDRLLAYLKRNTFKHISGLRNYTVLLAKGERVIMNVDNDAPPETYVLHKEERDRIRSERAAKRAGLITQMLEDASQILGRQINNEAEFYTALSNPAEYARLVDLEKKYFGFNPDENIGLIPQAMGEISTLEGQFLDQDGLGSQLRLTHQRYQSLMEPLSGYMVTASDFYYRRPRVEKESGEFKVMPVNTMRASRLVGRIAGDTRLPVMRNDLRGTMAQPVTGEDAKKVQARKVYYVAYPFILDQDTSGLAQFIRYLSMANKIKKNLQHTDQAALIVEGVGGFIGDTYVIFNRAALSNTMPMPSIGRDLRLEEPPYIVWVTAPVMEGQVTVAYSPVAGGQQREIGERWYKISYQDFTELVGGVARSFYEKAVAGFYGLLQNTPGFQGQGKESSRMRALGNEYMQAADRFRLSEEQREALLKGREVRAMLAAELGIQRGEKQVEFVNEQALDRKSNLEQQVRDMDLILVQYAVDFSLYHAGERYTPKDIKKDYLYRIKVENNKLVWEAVYPEIIVGEIAKIEVVTSSRWHVIEGKRGEIDLGNVRLGEKIQIEDGRYIILKRLPGQGIEAIAPSIVDDFSNEFISKVEKKASDQIRSDGEILILWPDIVESARNWREPGYYAGRLKRTFKKLPGTPGVTHEQNEYVLGLVKQARDSGRTEIITVSDEIKKLLKERAPPNWVTQQGVDFRWLVDKDKIRFQIDDLGEKELYPRDEKDTEGVFSFIEILYEKDVHRITEKEYEDKKEKKEDVKGYRPLCVIHLTKATYENIMAKKDVIDGKELNVYLLAQIVIHEFVEHFLEETHSEACESESYCNSTMGIRVSDLNRYLLERAAGRKNYKYLFGLIMQYDIRKDRDGTFLKAVYEAIDKLQEEFRDGSMISSGEEFTVWYRYIFEHELRRSDTAVFKIAKMINEKKTQNAALKKIVDESGDRWALKYDGSDIVLRKAKEEFKRLLQQFDIKYIYIPQCPIDLPSDEFIVLDVEYRQDVIERARGVLTKISESLERRANIEEIKAAIGDDDIFELFRREAVDEENRPIDLMALLKDIVSKFNSSDEGVREKVIIDVAGKIYNSPVVKFLGERVAQRYRDLEKPIGIGVIASGGVGKSTIATLLERELSSRGIRAYGFGTDSELYPGGGFRYEETQTKGRTVHIFGPGIYNSSKLRRMLRHIKDGGVVRVKAETHAGKGVKTIGPNTKVIILEGVFVGLDLRMAKKMDIQIALLANERSRILRKLGRDLGVRKGYEDVAFAIRDTVDKLFHEKTDGVKMVALKHADYIFAEELDGTRKLYVRKGVETAGMVRESVSTNIPLDLRCKVQRYEWGRKGGDNDIAQLIGARPQPDEPYAELWVGAHPKAPATVHITNPWIEEVRTGLDILIKYMREKILGRDVSDRFNGELPYLFKVLSAGKPLSIQAHPSKQQAEEGFAREDKLGIPLSAGNRNYKDKNHKPELICALTKFYALKGFRPLEEIAKVLEGVPEFKALIPDFRTRLTACGTDTNRKRDLLRDLYNKIINMNQQDVDRILQPLIRMLRNNMPQGGYPKETPEYWVLCADEEFCNERHKLYKDEDGHREHKDVGIFSIYLLNLVPLKPGEALYLPAGELHAYLDGVGLEIMANSDNVLRGGLTPKHVDVPELLRTLTFSSGAANVLQPQTVSPVEKVYASPTPEFRLSVLDLNKSDSYSSQSEHGPEAIIVTEGEVRIKDQIFRKGQTILISHEMGKYEITAVSDKVVVYKASVGIFQPAPAQPIQQRLLIPQAGPIGKKVQGGVTYSKLWEAEVRGAKVGEWKQLKDAEKRPDITPEQVNKPLNDVLDELIKVYGLGIIALVDSIRLVDNIDADTLISGQEGILPYGMMVKEGGRNILLLDIDAFKNPQVLYLILEHELKESIMRVVPCENEATREITTNYMSLKLGLELIREGRLNLREFMQILPQLGADEQFFKALEVLQAMVESGKEVTDNNIIAVAIEHMSAMPYYERVFSELPGGLRDVWAREVENKIQAGINRYSAALEVFNDIMEAKVGVSEVEKKAAREELGKVVNEVDINIKVINTFTGKMRIIGLEGLSRVLQQMIGAEAKQIYSYDRLAGQVVRAGSKKYILADNERLKRFKELIGEEEYRQMVEGFGRNNYQICTEVPDGVALGDVGRMVDPEDFNNMPKVEGMYYLPPMPYTRSAFYMAADVIQAEGDINRINPLVRELIFGLYPGLRDLPPAEQKLIFTKPWSSIILPMIQPIIENINYLHTAVIQIEKAA